MNDNPQRRLALAGAVMAVLVGVVCILTLTWDFATARVREPKDKAIIERLQEEVKQDSAMAAELAAGHDRITKARQARKARGDQLGILLLVSAAAFIGCSKWMLSMGERRPVAIQKLVQLSVPSPMADKSARKRRETGGATAEIVDLRFVDDVVATEGRGKEAAIPILQAIQSHYRYLPDEALRRVCELTEITPAQIAGTSSFYAQFRRSPVGRHVVRVCHGTACHVSGARQITDELRRRLEIPDGEDTDRARMFTVDEVACLGCCSLAPVMMVDEQTVGKLTPSSACNALETIQPREPA